MQKQYTSTTGRVWVHRGKVWLASETGGSLNQTMCGRCQDKPQTGRGGENYILINWYVLFDEYIWFSVCRGIRKDVLAASSRVRPSEVALVCTGRGEVFRRLKGLEIRNMGHCRGTFLNNWPLKACLIFSHSAPATSITSETSRGHRRPTRKGTVRGSSAKPPTTALLSPDTTRGLVSHQLWWISVKANSSAFVGIECGSLLLCLPVSSKVEKLKRQNL